MARKVTDASLVMRNCFWACAVRRLQRGSLLWDALDDWVLPKLGYPPRLPGPYPDRRRMFYRYYTTGHDPSGFVGPAGGLVQVLHADPQFASAKIIFESSFWTLVGPKLLSVADLRAMRRQAMCTVGLVTPTIAQRMVAERKAAPCFSGAASTTQDVAESMCNLLEGGWLDAVTVCATNYLLALDAGKLEYAIIYRDVLDWGIARLAERWGIEGKAKVSLHRLVRSRIIQRRNTLLPGAAIGFPRGSRKSAVTEQEDAANEPHPAAERMCSQPVVVATPETCKFLAQYAEGSQGLKDYAAELASGFCDQAEGAGDGMAEATERIFTALLCAPEDECDREMHALRSFAAMSPICERLGAELLDHTDPPSYSTRRPSNWLVMPIFRKYAVSQ